jgi:teichoic acid transport system ATP-binding protein
MGIFIFNNLGIVNVPENNQATLQTQAKDTYEDKLAQ